MILLNNRVVINTSISNVYGFIRDFKNIPLWNYYVKKVESITDKREQDFLYHQIRRKDDQIFEVVESLPMKKIVIKTVGSNNIKFIRCFSFLDDGAGNCLLDDIFEIDSGHPDFIQQLFKNNMNRAVKGNLMKLKELLEKGYTVLQDGRIINLRSQTKSKWLN
jgi:uncharacterized membrane protein